MALAACTTSGVATGGARDDIQREEVQRLADAGGTALSVIRQLRPRWLRARNPGTPRGGGEPIYAWVYLDEMPLGPIYTLEDVSSQLIERVEYLDLRDATIRYGEGYPGGVIRVVTKAPGRAPD